MWKSRVFWLGLSHFFLLTFYLSTSFVPVVVLYTVVWTLLSSDLVLLWRRVLRNYDQSLLTFIFKLIQGAKPLVSDFCFFGEIKFLQYFFFWCVAWLKIDFLWLVCYWITSGTSDLPHGLEIFADLFLLVTIDVRSLKLEVDSCLFLFLSKGASITFSYHW